MAKWICTDPDEHQWQRRLDVDIYEMVSVELLDYLNECQYSAAHGVFNINDYTNDFEYIFETYSDEEDMTDDRLAECVFECNICDFDLESFDTEAEAVAWINKFMEG